MKIINCLVAVILMAGVVLLTGCVSVGRKVDMEKSDQIHRGSTKAEVRSLIGAPDRVSKDADGVEMWTYTYVHSQVKGTTFIPFAGAFLGGTDTKDQSYVVTFTDGVVSNYASNTGNLETTADLQTGKERAK